LQATNKKDLF